jgi:hypothetical protein
MSYLPAEAIALAESAHGFLSRRDLGLHLTRHQIDNLVKAGVLIPMYRGGYRMAGTPVTQRLQLIAAVRRVDGVVADESALALRQLAGFELVPPFAIAVARRRSFPGLLAVRTVVQPQHMSEVEGMPAMTVERSLIGAAGRLPRPTIRSAFDALRGQGDIDPALLGDLAESLGDEPGAAEMRALLGSGELLMESEAERRLHAIWLPGDPMPVPQVWVRHRNRDYRLDFAFLDSRLAPEYDGEAAHSGPARHDDAARNLALAQLEIQRLPVTARMLHDPTGLREHILVVHRRRLELGLPPIVPAPPPAWWNGVALAARLPQTVHR